MAQPTLYIDGRGTVNGRTSKMDMDNPVAIHTFINNWLKTLPKHATNAAAVTANLAVGELYNNTTTNTITYVV